jgi:serine/threonine protein phosphatase 1
MSQRWIIPDIHGCAKTVKALLENNLKVTKHDQLYFLGDYIDRGPDGKGVLDYLMQLQKDEYEVHFLKGNHEDLCITAYEADQKRKFFGGKHNEQKEWEAVGAKETLESFGVKHPREIPKLYIDWMNSCLPYIELEHYILVHAGLNFNLKDPFEDTESMMWTRKFKVDFDKSHGKKVIHGHIPVDYSFMNLVVENNETYDFIALDNGVYVTNQPGLGNLMAFNPDTKQLVAQSNMDM